MSKTPFSSMLLLNTAQRSKKLMFKFGLGYLFGFIIPSKQRVGHTLIIRRCRRSPKLREVTETFVAPKNDPNKESRYR